MVRLYLLNWIVARLFNRERNARSGHVGIRERSSGIPVIVKLDREPMRTTAHKHRLCQAANPAVRLTPLTSIDTQAATAA